MLGSQGPGLMGSIVHYKGSGFYYEGHEAMWGCWAREWKDLSHILRDHYGRCVEKVSNNRNKVTC
jgi:hypothetical protein